LKCIKCRGKAQIKLPRHNARFCADHFREFFYGQVEKAIKKEKMFSFNDKILVAVSGGKDSLVLWEVLQRLGYHADGLYIDLGISDYSLRSKKLCEDFAYKRSLNLHLLSLPDMLGMGIKGISRKTRRPPCSSCGLIKRYLFNRFSLEFSYQVLATGHNLDDEAATLLGNTMHWQTGYLSRQSPVMPSNHLSMVKKVKPLYRLTEKEAASFAFLNEIDYILEECPMATGASSLIYKNALNYLEQNSPGTKQQFYWGYLKKGKEYFSHAENGIDLISCAKCHQPTVVETCAFCQLLEKIGLEKITLSSNSSTI